MLSGDKIAETFAGGPDYYIRNGNKIFLFENKDIFIDGILKGSTVFSQYKDFIDEKLVLKEGIGQLLNNIEFTLKKQYTFDKSYSISSCKIYPIIVTHRSEYDASGLNKYLKGKFRERLKKLQDQGLKTDRVRDLTVINIDTLLLNKYKLQDKSLLLENLIDEYHFSVNTRPMNAQTRESFNARIDDMYLSFHDYLMNNPDKERASYKDALVAWAEEMIRLFPYPESEN
ncbi:hypothetical protein [Spirosoma gilvum]